MAIGALDLRNKNIVRTFIQLLPGALRLPPSAEDTAWDSTDLRVQNWIEEKLLELEKE